MDFGIRVTEPGSNPLYYVLAVCPWQVIFPLSVCYLICKMVMGTSV